MASRRSSPVFLSHSPGYLRYLEDGPTGNLILPPYEQGPNGIIIVYGEVFCRVRGCANETVPFTATNNLRAHLRRHTLALETTPSGRLTQGQKDHVMAWYEGLFKGDEEEERSEDEGNEDDEEDEK